MRYAINIALEKWQETQDKDEMKLTNTIYCGNIFLKSIFMRSNRNG